MTALTLIQGGAGRQVAIRDDADGINGRMTAALMAIGLKAVHAANGAVMSFEVIDADTEIDEVTRTSLLARVEASLEPCAPEVLRIEAAKLKAGTATPGADVDVALRMQLLVDVMAEYPSDVARQAGKDQRRSNKWLPTENEMDERCKALVQPRIAAHASLQPLGMYGIWTNRMAMWERSGRKKWLGNWGPEPGKPRCWVPKGLLRHYEVVEQPDRAPPSDEEKRIVSELVAAWRVPWAGREMEEV
jgi:hypothetical protein